AAGVAGGLLLDRDRTAAGTAASPPRADLAGPIIEGRRRVTAHINLLGTMQADVNEVRREIFHERPFTGRIRDDQADLVPAKQFHERRRAEGFVAHFEGVTEAAFLFLIRQGWFGTQASAGATAERGRVMRIAWEDT